MGTKRRVCIWYMRNKSEYVVQPPGWKPMEGDIVFAHRDQMIKFARAARLVLKEKVNAT